MLHDHTVNTRHLGRLGVLMPSTDTLVHTLVTPLNLKCMTSKNAYKMWIMGSHALRAYWDAPQVYRDTCGFAEIHVRKTAEPLCDD